jgi:hypothetical protein
MQEENRRRPLLSHLFADNPAVQISARERRNESDIPGRGVLC